MLSESATLEQPLLSVTMYVNNTVQCALPAWSTAQE